MVLPHRALFYITLIRDANSASEYSNHTLECEIVNLKILPTCVISSKHSKFSLNCLYSMVL
jgi:hypothetical protein